MITFGEYRHITDFIEIPIDSTPYTRKRRSRLPEKGTIMCRLREVLHSKIFHWNRSFISIMNQALAKKHDMIIDKLRTLMLFISMVLVVTWAFKLIKKLNLIVINISDRKISITIHSTPMFRLILNDPWSRIDFVLEKTRNYLCIRIKTLLQKSTYTLLFQVKNLNAACEFIT